MLVSLYLDNHPYLFNGEAQTINFGGKYLYRFTNRDGKIVIDRKENAQFIESFFDITDLKNVKVSLLSAIVGENGTGKSTIIEIITSIVEDEKAKVFNYLLIFEEGNKIYIESNFARVIVEGLDVEIKYLKNTVIPYSTFYYSPHIDLVDSFIFSEFNISSKKQLLEDFHRKNEHNNRGDYLLGIDSHFNTRRIEFLLSPIFSELSKTLDFPNIDSKEGFLKIDDINFHDISIDFIENNIAQDFLAEIKRWDYLLTEDIAYNDFRQTRKKQLKFRFIEKVIRQFSGIFHMGGLDPIREYSTKNINVNNTLDIFFGYLEDAFFSKSKAKKIFHYYKLRVSDLQNILYREIDGCEEVKGKGFKIEYDKIKAIISAESEVLTSLIGFSSLAYPFINNYQPSRVVVFDANRKLSSGEVAFFSLFSNLYEAVRFRKIKKQNILFFIDEGDLGFHPQWKKKFIDVLLKAIPLFFQGRKTINVQFILTTHDPLTLSDFPNTNVTFMNREGIVSFDDSRNLPNTFGANISDLLANSFFIQDGLIGDFAMAKINKVIRWINENKENSNKQSDEFKAKLDENKKIISLINERVLRLKLTEMISELEDNSEYYNQQLQAEIDRLEKLIKKA